MLPKSRNVVWSPSLVPAQLRRTMLGHGAVTLWLTGLSGSGKSTLCRAIERRLVELGVNAYVLDGDNLRVGLCADLGFEPTDRSENIRRVGEVARLFNDAGVIVLTAFISPYRSDRAGVRETMAEGQFVEVHVDTPLEVCEARDVKGLYARARAGEISDFTGISAPYEAPETPEIRLPAGERDVDWCVEHVIDYLRRTAVIAP